MPAPAAPTPTLDRTEVQFDAVPEPDIPAPPLPTAVPQEWMAVPALVTAYTDHDPDAPLGADGEPLRQTAWKQRSTVTHPYGVAADPKLVPYGSKVLLPEYMATSFPDRAWEIEDTGGALRKSRREHFIVHLDLRYRTTYSAMKQGKQWMDITVEVTGWADEAKARLRHAAVNGQRLREQGRLP